MSREGRLCYQSRPWGPLEALQRPPCGYDDFLIGKLPTHGVEFLQTYENVGTAAVWVGTTRDPEDRRSGCAGQVFHH